MQKKLAYYSGYTYIRWQFLFLLLAGGLAYWYLEVAYFAKPSSLFIQLVALFTRILFELVLGLLALSMLSGLLAWSWLQFRRKRWTEKLNVKFGEGTHAEAGNVPVQVGLPGGFRPLFGTVTARLFFTDMTTTDPILLTRSYREKGKLFRAGIRGTSLLPLRDRKEYHIDEVQFMFRDMFRFTSLPCSVRFERHMYATPPELPKRQIQAEPNKTEEQLERIKIPKKVEGEFLHYKDFESGDDVRRIVWKIYARTRQLVVRIPEITDPYASHIYFYASFYHGFYSTNYEDVDQEILNGYKDQLRNLFESVQANGYEVRFIPDQETSRSFSVSEKEKPLYHISTASWQRDRDLKAYVNTRDMAVVCITPLVPADDVALFLSNCPPNVTVALVRSTDVLERRRVVRLADLFFRRRKDPMNRLVRRWKFSGHRRQILQNEKAIIALLQQSAANVITT